MSQMWPLRDDLLETTMRGQVCSSKGHRILLGQTVMGSRASGRNVINKVVAPCPQSQARIVASEFRLGASAPLFRASCEPLRRHADLINGRRNVKWNDNPPNGPVQQPGIQGPGVTS